MLHLTWLIRTFVIVGNVVSIELKLAGFNRHCNMVFIFTFHIINRESSSEITSVHLSVSTSLCIKMAKHMLESLASF